MAAARAAGSSPSTPSARSSSGEGPRELARASAGQALISGMPAETFIAAGERTALTYLLKPFLDALTSATKAE